MVSAPRWALLWCLIPINSVFHGSLVELIWYKMSKLKTYELGSWWVSAEKQAGHSRFISNKGKWKRFQKIKEVSLSGKMQSDPFCKRWWCVLWEATWILPSLDTIKGPQNAWAKEHLQWVAGGLELVCFLVFRGERSNVMLHTCVLPSMPWARVEITPLQNPHAHLNPLFLIHLKLMHEVCLSVHFLIGKDSDEESNGSPSSRGKPHSSIVHEGS